MKMLVTSYVYDEDIIRTNSLLKTETLSRMKVMFSEKLVELK